MLARHHPITQPMAWVVALLCGVASLAWTGESRARWQDNSPSASENAGVLTAYLMVTPPPSAPVTVTWRTNAESAVAGRDYVDVVQTVTFAAGENRKAVTVTLIDDAFNAGNRTVGLQITAITGANWDNPNYVSATIIEDDLTAPPATQPTVAWAPASTVVPSGAGPTGFNLALGWAWTAPVTVQWQTNPHSAVAGSDFVAASGSLTFAPGTTVLPAVVDILPTAVAGREFGLQITAIQGGAWGTPNYQAITIGAAAQPVEAPVITPVAGTYANAIVATAGTATAGAELRYRLDGLDPTATDPLLPAAGLTIDLPQTLSVRGFQAGWLPSATVQATYAFQVAAVTADLAAGTYVGPRSVVLSTATDGAALHYTLDGSVPTAASALATGPIELPGSCTLRAIALRDGWIASPLFKATYRLAVPIPVLSPAPGPFAAPLRVTASEADAQAELRYTVDGQTPTATSPLWPIDGVQIVQTTTLRLRAFRAGWQASSVRSGTYTLRVGAVTASLPGGTYIGEQQVELATSTPGAVIRYTLDGSMPDAGSPVADGPIALAATATLRAIASVDGWRDSPVFRATYTIRVAPVTASLPGGLYVGPQQVLLSTVTPGATITYTLDGSAPNASSPVADGPIQLPGTVTLRAVASVPGWRDSVIYRATYTLQVAPVEASLPVGTYDGEQSVSLSTATVGAEIHYTLDGTVPGAASPIVDAPIPLSGNRTLRAIAMLSGWRSSPSVRLVYSLRVPAPTLDPAGGTYPAWPRVTAASVDAQATVRYTFGSTVPKANSPVFPTAGVQLSQPTTVNLVATRSGWTMSLPVSAAYERNLPPVPAPIVLSGDEDAAISGQATASDAESDALTWAVSSEPAHGSLSLDPATGTFTYQPAADFAGTDAFTLAVSDAWSTVLVEASVTVQPVNDPPVLAAIETSLAWFRDGDAALPVSATLAVSDVDDVNLSGATIAISGNHQTGDVLQFTDQNGIVGAWDPTTGTLTLSGAATVASYQSALRSVRYLTSEIFPATAARSVDLQVGDGQAVSNVVSRTVAVVTRSAAPWSEGFEGLTAGADLYQQELLGATRWHAWDAVPAASAAISAVQAHSGANAVVIAGSSDLVHEYKGVNAGGWRYSAWQYIPNGFTGQTYFILLNAFRDNGSRNWSTQVYFNGSTNRVHSDFDNSEAVLVKGRWVELRVDIDFAANQQRFFYDGVQLYQKSWTAGTTGGGTINLAAVDLYGNGSGPVYYDDLALAAITPSLSGGGSATYVENAAPVAIDPGLVVSDFGVSQIDGAVVRITGNLRADQDRLTATMQGGVSATWDQATGTLVCSGTATPAVYQAVLRSVAYDNSSEAPDAAQRSVSFTVTGGGVASNTVVSTLQVTPVDDPADIITPASVGPVGAGSDLVISGIAISDRDSATIDVIFTASAGTVSLPLAGGGATISGDAATIATALSQVVYRAAGTAGTPSIQVTANGTTVLIPVTVVAAPAPITVLPLDLTVWPASAVHATQLLPETTRIYHLDVQASGDYHCWLRGAAATVQVDIDGAPIASVTLPRASAWTCGGTGPVLTLSLSAGPHTLAWRGSAALDQLMLVPATPAAIATGDPALVAPGGLAVIAASDYESAEASRGYAWLPAAGGVLRHLPDVGNLDEVGGPGGGITFSALFAQPGSYRIWVRGTGDFNGDSVHVALDGGPSAGWLTGFRSVPAWGNADASGHPVDVSVTTAGMHTITVRFREDGPVIHEIAISGMTGWSPPTVALAPSVRQGVAEAVADGSILIEAEAAAQYAPDQTAHAWQAQPIAGAIGTAIRALPDNGQFYAAADRMKSPAAVWYVRFPAAGTYDVWGRGAGPDWGGDSFHFGLAGNADLSADVSLQLVGTGLPFAWTNYRLDASTPRITVPAAGVYAVNLWMREDGAVLDRLLIQPAGRPRPTGDGPVASPIVPAITAPG
jgi:hypothetical protein